MPIWFNKYLKTKFDADISSAGFNVLKDFFPGGQCINLNPNMTGLTLQKTKKLQRILDKIPQELVNFIERSDFKCTVISPRQVVHINNHDSFVPNLGSNQIYKNLISKIFKPPVGTIRWKAELAVSDQQLKTAFTFAKRCSSLIFNQAFQYKITTQILPTNKYLNRYQVKDSDLCSRCLERTDTVYHNLWQCSRLTPYLSACLEILRSECNLVDEIINAENYLFGLTGLNREGINNFLLELKNIFSMTGMLILK